MAQSDLQRQLLTRVAGLIGKSYATIDSRNSPGFLETAPYWEWRSQTAAFLDDVLGPQHTYTKTFEQVPKNQQRFEVERGRGILLALQSDLMSGNLTDVATIVSAEVFADFLEMSQHLLDHGYIHAAASLTGAVLEDGLRRIALKVAIPLDQKENLTTLNNKCAAKQIYTVITKKKIEVWTVVRNNADHGHFDKNSKKDVREMHDGVAEFLSQHLR